MTVHYFIVCLIDNWKTLDKLLNSMEATLNNFYLWKFYWKYSKTVLNKNQQKQDKLVTKTTNSKIIFQDVKKVHTMRTGRENINLCGM